MFRYSRNHWYSYIQCNRAYALLGFELLEFWSKGQHVNWKAILYRMVQFCCVPRCSNRSDKESHLLYFGLPLKDKKLLKQWVHVIWWKNLLLNSNTKICNEHFVNARSRQLYPGEVPSLLLPTTSTTHSREKGRRKLKDRTVPLLDESVPVGDGNELEETCENMKETSSQTDNSEHELACELSATKERVN